MYFVVGAAGDGGEEADGDLDEEEEEAWVVVSCVVEFFGVGLSIARDINGREGAYRSRGG